jgi:hypothetical protein
MTPGRPSWPPLRPHPDSNQPKERYEQEPPILILPFPLGKERIHGRLRMISSCSCGVLRSLYCLNTIVENMEMRTLYSLISMSIPYPRFANFAYMLHTLERKLYGILISTKQTEVTFERLGPGFQYCIQATNCVRTLLLTVSYTCHSFDYFPRSGLEMPQSHPRSTWVQGLKRTFGAIGSLIPYLQCHKVMLFQTPLSQRDLWRLTFQLGQPLKVCIDPQSLINS